MATKITNPRFPHRCRVYRRVGVTPLNPQGTATELLYTGPCRKSSSTNIRTFNTGTTATGKVDIADYRISIPGIIPGICKGDLVDVTDLITTEKEMRIVNIESTTLTPNPPNNSNPSNTSNNSNTSNPPLPGSTALLCNAPSN